MRSAVAGRVSHLQSRLRKNAGELPEFTFSFGVAELPAAGDPDEALRAADQSMYCTKTGQPVEVTA